MLGSTRELTDSNEDVTDTYLYDAWGNSIAGTGSTTNPYEYIGALGYMTEAEVDGYYVRRRYLRADEGRWLSRDPMDPQPRYDLASNRTPVKLDPSGLQASTSGSGMQEPLWPPPNTPRCRYLDKRLRKGDDDSPTYMSLGDCSVLDAWLHEYMTHCLQINLPHEPPPPHPPGVLPPPPGGRPFPDPDYAGIPGYDIWFRLCHDFGTPPPYSPGTPTPGSPRHSIGAPGPPTRSWCILVNSTGGSSDLEVQCACYWDCPDVGLKNARTTAHCKSLGARIYCDDCCMAYRPPDEAWFW